MNKLLKSLSVLTVMFLFISCAAFQAKREVLPGNVFSTTHPSLMLKIDDGFVYKGIIGKSGNVKEVSSPTTGKVKYEYHLWSKGSTNIAVIFAEILHGWTWYGSAGFDKKSTIQIKNEKLAGKKWTTGFWTVRLSKFERDNFTNAGVDVIGDNFSKLWTRDAGRYIIIRICYLENIDNNINTKTIVQRGITLDKEMKFIEEFNKRADAAITFTK